MIILNLQRSEKLSLKVFEDCICPEQTRWLVRHSQFEKAFLFKLGKSGLE